MRTIFVLLSAIITVMVLNVLTSCTEDDQLDLKLKSEYVFFEKLTQIRGEVISGSYDSSLVIDFPTYTFYEETGELRGNIQNFNIDEKLKIIFGGGLCLSGAAGGGCSSSLAGITELPATEDEITFTSLDEYGTVRLNYNTKQLQLVSGEIRIYTDTTLSFQDSGKARIITETKLINHGFERKSKIYSN